MKPHQPTAEFKLAVPAMNKCTSMLTAGITAILIWFYDSADVSPFMKQFSILKPFFSFPKKIICAFGISLDSFQYEYVVL